MHIKCGVPSGVNLTVWHCAAILHVLLAMTSSNTIFLSHNTTQFNTVDLWDQSKFCTEVKSVKIRTDVTVSFNISHRTSSRTDTTGQLVFDRLIFFIELLKKTKQEIPDVKCICASTRVKGYNTACALHQSLSRVGWHEVIEKEVRKMVLDQKWWAQSH